MVTLRTLFKIPTFHLNSPCGNFVESNKFRIVSGKSPEITRKLPFHKISTPGNWVKLRYFMHWVLLTGFPFLIELARKRKSFRKVMLVVGVFCYFKRVSVCK